MKSTKNGTENLCYFQIPIKLQKNFQTLVNALEKGRLGTGQNCTEKLGVGHNSTEQLQNYAPELLRNSGVTT